MNLKLVNLNEFGDEHVRDIIEFCRTITANPNSAADKNMEVDDYQNKPHTLLYTLLVEKRFAENKGIFNLLYLDDRLISLSGAYKSDFDQRAVIGGVRTYTLPEIRNDFYHSEHILPAQIDWARSQNAEVFCLTFNEYNTWLAKFVERAAKGKATVLGRAVPSSLLGFERHPNLVNIKSTKQILLKKYLINNCAVNFHSIEEQ